MSVFNIPRTARNYRGWIAIDEKRDNFQAPATTLGDLGLMPRLPRIVSGGINPFSVSQMMRYVSAEADQPDSHPMFAAAWQPPGFRRRRRGQGSGPMGIAAMARSIASRGGMSRGGMSGLWEELQKTGGAAFTVIDQKTERLENALKLIIMLSGVAAVTGAATFLTGGMPHLFRR